MHCLEQDSRAAFVLKIRAAGVCDGHFWMYVFSFICGALEFLTRVPETQEVLAPYLEVKAPGALATRLRESRPPKALTEGHFQQKVWSLRQSPTLVQMILMSNQVWPFSESPIWECVKSLGSS